MQPTVQSPQDIINQLLNYSNQLSTNVPQVKLPSLNVQLPSASDLDSLYQQFLTRASNDPDIVNYYNQILQQAQGDTQIAQNFLEQDYQTGVRNTMENTNAALKQLGLTFNQENQGLQDTLNRRGIALTQGDDGKLTYAGGGQSGTELSQLQQGQNLRNEAQQRSSQQSLQGLNSALQKGLTSTGQQLSSTAQGIEQQKQADILNRANTYYGMAQNQQGVNANQQLQKQQQTAAANPYGTGNTYPTMPTTQSNNQTNPAKSILTAARVGPGIA